MTTTTTTQFMVTFYGAQGALHATPATDDVEAFFDTREALDARLADPTGWTSTDAGWTWTRQLATSALVQRWTGLGWSIEAELITFSR